MIKMLMCLFLLACATSGKNAKVEITLEKDLVNNTLRLSYKFPKKIRLAKLAFGDLGLKNSWNILNEDLTLVENKKRELFVVSSSNNSFDNIVVKMNLKKNHFSENLYRFSDNLLLFKAGSISLVPVEGKIDDYRVLKLPQDIILSAQKSDDVFYKNQFSNAESIEILDLTFDEFIFWGNLKNVLKEDKIFFTSQLNSKIKNELKKTVNQLNQFYSEQFGKTRTFPAVFISDSSEMKMQWGTNGILLKVNSRSKVLLEDDYDRLHNAYLAYYLQLPSSKLNELVLSSLQYLSLKHQKELGHIKQNNFDRMITKYFNLCTIKAATDVDEEQQKLYCDIAKVIILDKNLKNGLSGFLKKYFDKQLLGSEEKLAELFAEYYEDNAINEDIALFDLMNTKFDDNGIKLKQLMQKLNVQQSPLKDYKKEIYEVLGTSMVEQLYQKNCQGKISVKNYAKTVYVAGKSYCESFSQDFYVYSINNFPIYKDAFNAYEYARRSCLTRGFTEFQSMSGRTLKVNCFNLKGPFVLFEVHNF